MGSSPSAPASPAAVVLHIGAHKTASTHFQKTLLAHRADLSVVGCCYIGPDILRRRTASAALGDVRNQPPRLDQIVATAHDAGQHVLVSDENILGRPCPPFIAEGGTLYPQAAARVSAFLARLGCAQVTLALSVRDPLTFLISAHGHQAMAGRPTPFDGFISGIEPLALHWSDMVARLLDCAEVARIILWRFEDYPRLAPKLGSALLGLPDAGPLLAQSAAPQLTGVSAQALVQAQALLAKDPTRDPKRTVRQQMRLFPKSLRYPPLQPFSPACVAQSRAQYDTDWDRLRKWADVTCLTL
ncbi:hypothetical protein [Roseinatronobacter thiooxidans]|uniref:hypothetical protein n=1 Tax=Roseinatronobacter thiooxidans TaxID=121821 RepID=UPI0011604954|nr:hypothetical protein [Roseinatronobacter thiooxidans]